MRVRNRIIEGELKGQGKRGIVKRTGEGESETEKEGKMEMEKREMEREREWGIGEKKE